MYDEKYLFKKGKKRKEKNNTHKDIKKKNKSNMTKNIWKRKETEKKYTYCNK